MSLTHSKPTDVRSPELAELVEQLSARIEAGETINWEEVEREFPEQAAAARLLLPTLKRLAELSRASGATAPSGEPLPLGELGDYRIIREIGRGGMGVVYEAEQMSLSRRVALKVLPFAAVMDPRHLQRFKNEARSAASLDHPNVVKVYGVGCERGVHFIALQFVDGRSMADLIRERSDGPTARADGDPHATRTFAANLTDHTPTVSRPPVTNSRTPLDAEFVRRATTWGIHAAEALEHAHGLGIVHRDIKPGNLLIDGRGEVFVADFGLAKLASDPGVTGTDDMLGTLRYMSPEQAGAQHDLVDHRSDVYSLGVTLYELLTLTPAFDGIDRQEVLSKVVGSDPLSPRKLDRSVPRDLETVVLKAMEKDPSRRYRSAREFADDLRRFLNRESVRARRPGMRDRLGKWARRNRAAVVTTVVVGVVALGALSAVAGYVYRDRTTREQAAGELLARSKVSYVAGDWPRALAEARQADVALGGRSGEAMRRRVADWLRDLEMVERVDDIRLAHETPVAFREDGSMFKQIAIEYARAFREYGVDLEEMSAEEATRALREKPVCVELAAALDHWGEMRRKLGPEYAAETRRLIVIAGEIDPDPVRGKVREFLARTPPAAREEQIAFAKSLNVEALPPATVAAVAAILIDSKVPEAAEAFLRRGWEKHPADFWLNSKLGGLLSEKKPPDAESVRFFAIAMGVRPNSERAHMNLGAVLHNLGRYSAAEIRFREAIRLKPDSVVAHCTLAQVLAIQGRKDEARIFLRKASDYLAARVPPDRDAQNLNSIGGCYMLLGSPADAAISFQKAIDLLPRDAGLRNNLGEALRSLNRFEDAATSFKESFDLKPDYFDPLMSLGALYCDHLNKPESAAKCFREAIKIDASNSVAHSNLGNALYKLDQFEKASESYREAIKLNPNNYGAQRDLGLCLYELDRFKEAVPVFQEVIRLNPDELAPYMYLGSSLRLLDRLEESSKVLHAAVRLKPNDIIEYRLLASAFYKSQRVSDSAAILRLAIQCNPRDPEARLELANRIVEDTGDYEEAEHHCREGIKVKPEHVNLHIFLGRVLRKLGKLEEAEASVREAVNIQPKSSQVHTALSQELFHQQKYAQAAQSVLDAIRLKPEDPDPYYKLASALRMMGKFDEALTECRKGEEQGKKLKGWKDPYAPFVRTIEQQVALNRMLPKVIAWETIPADFQDQAKLALVAKLRRCYATSAKLYEKVLRNDPGLKLDVGTDGARFQAACAAIQASCGHGEDANTIDDKDRLRWRRRAYGWLTATLTRMESFAASGPSASRKIRDEIIEWMVFPDLSPIRDESEIRKLPPSEQADWRELWANVAELRAKSDGPFLAPPPHEPRMRGPTHPPH